MQKRKRDDADRFREESLRAIRNKKRYARILYRLTVSTAIIMVALAIAVYFLT